MTGTICISDDHEIDLSPIELAGVADSLRAHTGAAEVRVMRELFWPMDEGGIACMLADELDAAEFEVFAAVVRRAHEAARNTGVAAFALWERLLAAVQSDLRSPDRWAAVAR